jgi:hypothetical protein
MEHIKSLQGMRREKETGASVLDLLFYSRLGKNAFRRTNMACGRKLFSSWRDQRARQDDLKYMFT